MNKKWLLKMGTSMGMMLIPSMLWANAFGTVNADLLNVRKVPATTGEVVAKVKSGETLEIVESADGWYKVKLPNAELAYVKDDFLSITRIQGTTKVNNQNLRTYPSLTKSSIMMKIPLGAKVNILYQVDNFYKISYNGVIGFAYAEYIDVPFNTYVLKQKIEQVKEIVPAAGNNNSTNSNQSTGTVTEEQEKPKDEPVKEELKEEIKNENSGTGKEEDKVTAGEEIKEEIIQEGISHSLGEEIVQFAIQFLGNPYRYGGNDLLTGVDCSGFTQQVMKVFNITIPRISRDQSKAGIEVMKDEIQKGDLIFFGSSPEAISHVGIYIGDSQMIHSSTPATGIIISGAFNSGGNPIQAIRRMVK